MLYTIICQRNASILERLKKEELCTPTLYILNSRMTSLFIIPFLTCMPSAVLWMMLVNCLMKCLVKTWSLVLFPQMLHLGLQPNQFALSSLLKASGARPNDKHGRQVHAFCLKYGCDSNVYVGSSLVDMYARFNLINEAQVVFDGLVSKNEVSWNALIAGHARKGAGERAVCFGRCREQILNQLISPIPVCLAFVQALDL